MGAFLSSEDVARNDEVEATYLTKTAADSDFVKQGPFNTGIETVRNGYEADIRNLRGGYDRSLSDLKSALEGDYNGKFTGLKGTYTGTMENIYNDYNDKFTGLRDGYNGTLSGLKTDLENDYNGKFVGLKGGYNGTLSGLKTVLENDYGTQIRTLGTTLGTTLSDDYNVKFDELKGEYDGTLSDLKSVLEGDYNGKFDALRGDYDETKTLKDLDGELRAYSLGQINNLKGDDFKGNLTQFQTLSNTQYATLNQLFTDFKDNTYTPDKASILQRANEIESLINRTATGITSANSKMIEDFKKAYDEKLSEKVNTSRFNEIANSSLTGLSPIDITRIKTIINSNNFTSLYNDLRTRGVINEVPATQGTTTPTTASAQFLRHLRNRNYMFY